MSDLTERILSAVLLITVSLTALFARQEAFSLLVCAYAWLVLKEFYGITRRDQTDRNPSEMIGYTGLIFLFLIASGQAGKLHPLLHSKSDAVLWVVIGVLVVALSAEFFYRVHEPIRNTGATLMGMAYTGLFGFVVMLNNLPGREIVALIPWPLANGNLRVLHLLLIVWASDLFAYFIGRRACGRNKLCETLSPKKTWEGSMGGLTGAIIASGAFGSWFGFGLVQSIAIGVVVGIAAQLGDLAASAIKREFGVKDSGDVSKYTKKLFAGHGGALDRLDSVIMAAPVYYLLAIIIFR